MDVHLTAKRLLWGRFSNAGQVRTSTHSFMPLLSVSILADLSCARVCTRPRALPGYAHRRNEESVSVRFILLPHLRPLTYGAPRRYKTFYPDGPENSDSFARVVTTAHTQRIKKRLDETKGKIVLGGATDVEKRYIAPTVVRDVPVDDSLLTECVLRVCSCFTVTDAFVCAQGDLRARSPDRASEGRRRGYLHHSFQVRL